MKRYLSIIITLSFLLSQERFSNLDVFNLQHARDPQISPTSSKIIYVRTKMDIMKDGKTSSIWIVDIDGRNHQKLTSNINNESSPRWSPDGKRITFVSSSDDGNGSEIYIYWVDSKQYSVISQLNKSPSNLKWSPSGEYIGFSMFMTDNVLSLVTPPKKPKDANWAPPARITDRLKHESDGSGYIDKGFNHLFYISADGGSPVQVTSELYNHKDFNWSKDSEKIIFSSNYTENWEYDFRNSEMYSIKINGSSLTQLTNRKGPDYGGVFSPDGKKIAYLGFTDKVQTYQINKLYLMNADGSAKKEIKTTLDRNMSSLKWASDGKGLYFKYDNFGNGKIGYISISGKTKKIADNLGGTTIGRPYGGGSYSLSNTDRIAFTMTTPYHPADIAYYDG